MRKVFLEDLPMKKGFGANKDKEIVDWTNSVGLYVEFVYEDLNGKIYIKSYNRKNQKLTVLYNDRESDILTASFKDGAIGCVIGKINNYHIYDINTIINGVKVIDKIIMNGRLGYKVECIVDGYIRNIAQYDLSDNVGCPVCSGHRVLKGVNDLATTHSDLIEYFVNIEDAYTYSFGSEKIVILKCKDCGLEKRMPIKDLVNQGFACNRCSDGASYPNRFMTSLLSQLNLEFIPEYAPEWAIDKIGSQRRYDFYLPDYNIIIEMDGGFHYKDNRMTGEKKEDVLEIDKFKDMVANMNGIAVIRVDCNYMSDKFKYVKNNVIEVLSHIFDLSDIEWELINELSLNSRVKEVCDLWSSGKYKTTSYLSRNVNISKYTTLRYLKIGNDLGWCKYDAQEEIQKNNKRPKEYVKKEKTLENISDMTKEICKLWEDGIHSTTEIANIIGATNTSIIMRHLLVGYDLGICRYTKEDARKYKYSESSAKKKNTITEITQNVCNLWNKGTHSTGEISEILGISRPSTLYNLKKGTRLGICDYSVEIANEHKVRKISETKKKNSKKVVVVGYETIYSSIGDLCEVSEEVFGVKFNQTNVCQVCNGEKKSHRGYKFEYVI